MLKRYPDPANLLPIPANIQISMHLPAHWRYLDIEEPGKPK